MTLALKEVISRQEAANLIGVINRATVEQLTERATLVMDVLARTAEEDRVGVIEDFLTTWDHTVLDTENALVGEQMTAREFNDLSGYMRRITAVIEFIAAFNPTPTELAAMVYSWIVERPTDDHPKSGVMMVGGLISRSSILPYRQLPQDIIDMGDHPADEVVIDFPRLLDKLNLMMMDPRATGSKSLKKWMLFDFMDRLEPAARQEFLFEAFDSLRIMGILSQMGSAR